MVRETGSKLEDQEDKRRGHNVRGVPKSPDFGGHDLISEPSPKHNDLK